MANFNPVASIYDFLKKIVYGKQLEVASNHFLNDIPANSNILIIGGGTGKILRNFNSSHYITYVELSEVMIKKAKGINSKANVKFIETDILEWTSNDKFDYVITPFVLDCFYEDELNLILTKLKYTLNIKGKWIQTDFYPKNRAHKVLINIMYLFFYLSANLRVKKLADFDSLFKSHNFIFKRKALFFHSMVESKIYQHID